MMLILKNEGNSITQKIKAQHSDDLSHQFCQGFTQRLYILCQPLPQMCPKETACKIITQLNLPVLHLQAEGPDLLHV